MITDYRKVPPQPIAYPRAGEWFTDAFGAKILRVTDETHGALCQSYYAYWPAMNADSTRMLIACDDVPRLVYIGSGGAPWACPDDLIRPGDPPLLGESACWSRQLPDVLYALDRKAPKLWRLNVATRACTLVADLPTTKPAKHLTMSAGGGLFAFLKQTAAGPVPVVYSKALNQFFVYRVPAGMTVNECQVHPRGLLINFEGGGVVLWKWAADTTSPLLPNATSHWSVGGELLANGDGIATGIQVRSFAEPMSPVNVLRYLRSDGKLPNWTVGDHVSLAADDSRLLVSTYGRGAVDQPFEHEIILLTSGSGWVWQRVCHTHSVPVGDKDYQAEPRASLSPDGKWAVWTARLNGGPRTDVLATRLP